MSNLDILIDKRFKIIDILGSGGMSKVYLAKDLITQDLVVFKVLKPESLKKIDNLIRFNNEINIAKKLNHPNIVKYITSGKYNNLPYIIYEYTKMSTLRDDLDLKRFYSPKEATTIMLEIVEAIIYIHSLGIIHRDIKPLNIFYSKTGEIKLSDFGISTFYNSAMNINENKRVMGTPQYMAPEVLLGEKNTFQSDIYSLGITFFELISGRVPFSSNIATEIVHNQVHTEVPSILKLMPNTPDSIVKIIAKCCEKKPSKRYKTALDLKNDLLTVLNNKKEMKKNVSFFARFFGINKK